MEFATLQHNVERAIRFEREADGNGKPVMVVDSDSLEVEVFLRVRGSESTPKLLGTYPISEIHLGEDS